MRHTIQPAGQIKRIAAALLVDDVVEVEQKGNQRVANRRKRTPDEMKQIEGLAAAALGIDAKRGDLLAVENLSFQTLQQDAPLPPTLLEKLQRNLQQLDLAVPLPGAGLPVRQCLLATAAAAEKTDADRLPRTALDVPPPAGCWPEKLNLANWWPVPRMTSWKTFWGWPDIDTDPALKKLAVLKNHLVEKVKTEPAGASQLVQNWLHEGGVE